MGNQGICWQNHPYSKAEIDFLQDSAEEIQDPEQRKEVAKAIGRSAGSVYARAKQLGIITVKRGRATVEKIFYARRRANLKALKSMICTRCGDPLLIEKGPLDVFDFRLLGRICGHSFYFLDSDLAKLTRKKNIGHAI